MKTSDFPSVREARLTVEKHMERYKKLMGIKKGKAMIELPEIFKVMLPGNPYPAEMVHAGDCQTYGNQRAAEAREQMLEELLPLLKRMANNYGWVEHTPEYPNDDGWRSVGHDGLMMIRKLEKLQ